MKHISNCLLLCTVQLEIQLYLQHSINFFFKNENE